MFSARQNWSTVKLGSLTSARFAPRAGLCSKDTLRLHVYSYVGTCITPDAQKNPRTNIPVVGPARPRFMGICQSSQCRGLQPREIASSPGHVGFPSQRVGRGAPRHNLEHLVHTRLFNFLVSAFPRALGKLFKPSGDLFLSPAPVLELGLRTRQGALQAFFDLRPRILALLLQ